MPYPNPNPNPNPNPYLTQQEHKQALIEEKRELAVSQQKESPLITKTREMQKLGEERRANIVAHQLKQNERTTARHTDLKDR